MKLTKHDMECFAIVTLHLQAIWTYFTSIVYATLFTVYNICGKVGDFGRSERLTRLQIGLNFTHKNCFDYRFDFTP